MQELAGRVAVVSGASRGLGAAIAVELAAAGATVAVNYVRSADAATSVVANIENAGAAARAVQGDVTTSDGAQAVVAQTVDAWGGVDVLVNNAFGRHLSTPLPDVDVAADEEVLRFAVAAPVLLGLAALPWLRASGAGRIVNIGREIVDRPAVGFSAYTTAKAAAIGLTRAWAVELADAGITVNLVAPGFVPVERHADVDDSERAAYVDQVPAGRIGVPDDIAAVVDFLASQRAAFVTGQVVTVNGGRTFG